MNIDLSKFPVVVRLAGVNEDEAKKLYAKAGVEYYGDEITMEDAAKLIVDKMKKAYPGEGR
jgi:succinyl-CoA synthetase beta subunit